MRQLPWFTPESAAQDDIPRELMELGDLIAKLPEANRPDLAGTYARVLDCMKRRRRVLTLVQEALSQLRLDIKYLMFDLDMTRKERDDARAELAERRRCDEQD